MKKLLLLLALIVMPSSAFATSFYVAPRISYGYQIVELATFHEKNHYFAGTEFGFNASVFNGAIAAGYDLGNTRIEGEFGYFSDAKVTEAGDFGSAGNSIKTLFLNVNYDFDLGSSFSPYIGAGIGMAMHKPYAEVLGTRVEADPITSLAANAGLGVSYELNNLITFELGYRLSYLGMPEESSYPGFGTTGAYLMNQLILGARFNF